MLVLPAILLAILLGAGQKHPSDSLFLALPAIEKGETIIEYGGYDDIRYKGEDRTHSDTKKTAFIVSFDISSRMPGWVAYELSRDELDGYASRKGKSFREDDSAGVPQASSKDYRNSGWTKGHLAPAADFKWSDSALSDTFFFTNCCPQDEELNGGSWEKLESRVRSWTRQFGVVYVVTGPIIGDRSNGYLGDSRIPIPDAFFKAVLVRDGNGYQAVGFIMENSPSAQPYPQCAVPVDRIEEITGLDLFCALDDDAEKEAESGYNHKFWGLYLDKNR